MTNGNSILALVNDVDTRWMSVLLLCRRFLALKSPVRLTLMNSSVSAEDLSNKEWDLLKDTVELLEPFNEVGLKFACSAISVNTELLFS